MSRSILLAVPLLLFAAKCLAQTGDVNSSSYYSVIRITSDHQVPARWGSNAPGYGIATLNFTLQPPTINYLMVLVGHVRTTDLASAGPEGILGPMHFHNFPQGGPNFFVQQLPGKYVEIGNHFYFELRDWKMDPPGNRPDISPLFVLQEILDGNAYLGIHTSHNKCSNGPKGTCAAPATALAGDITVN